MKRTFLSKRNALLSGRSVPVGAFSLAVVLLILGIRIVAPNIFWQLFSPIFNISDTLASESHTFLNHFSDAAKLASLQERLTAENAMLVSENQTLLKKTADLAALFGSNAQKDIPGILAGVVARPPMSPYDTLELAMGEKEGVVLGMEAFGPGDVPVGFVSSVTAHFSRVTLFSFPGVVMNGWVGPTSTPLTLTGVGAGTLQTSVARAANIGVGNVVFVPGPGMKAIGSVVRVDSDPLSPGVTLRVMLAVSPFSISWVVLRATGAVPGAFATGALP